MPERLRVGIIGAAGYTGAELVRLIHQHPRLSLEYVAAKERAGQRLDQALPSTTGIPGLGDRVLESFEPEKALELRKRCEVMFTALPHEASAHAAPALLEADLTVVDLSAAFRIKDVAAYQPWYGQHPTPSLLPRAVYGLPELHRRELAGARLIAVPGCYPTATVLSLSPLLASGLVERIGPRPGRGGRGRVDVAGADPLRGAKGPTRTSARGAPSSANEGGAEHDRDHQGRGVGSRRRTRGRRGHQRGVRRTVVPLIERCGSSRPARWSATSTGARDEQDGAEVRSFPDDHLDEPVAWRRDRCACACGTAQRER